jgi:UDPglucose--hexose-1-phosphate uridylyltransferase
VIGDIIAAAADQYRGDPSCEGARTPDYTATYVFDNDFAALNPDTPPDQLEQHELLLAESERGICGIVCFSPRHDLTLGQMEQIDVRRVVDTWTDQCAELRALDGVNHVLIFENRGAMIGASNPHPHGQIWANQRLPNEAVRELHQQQRHGTRNLCLLCSYLAIERREGERIVCQNDHFVVLVPF